MRSIKFRQFPEPKQWKSYRASTEASRKHEAAKANTAPDLMTDALVEGAEFTMADAQLFSREEREGNRGVLPTHALMRTSCAKIKRAVDLTRLREKSRWR